MKSFKFKFNHSPTGKTAVILTTLDCVEYIRDKYSFQYMIYMEFVGASPFEPAEGFGTVHNSHEYRGDQMLPETRQYLKALFRPYNELLADTLGEEWRGVWD